MSSYDKTINRLAKSKARLSPNQRLADLNVVNSDLRVLNKRNQDTKNFVEYKATQIVRCQDRIRQTTLSSRYKMFSKLARDVERTQDSGIAVANQLLKNSKSQSQLRRNNAASSYGLISQQEISSKTLEHIIEQTKTNRKLKERSMGASMDKSGYNSFNNKSQLNTSQMSLTDFYMSRSQCDVSKIKRTYKN